MYSILESWISTNPFVTLEPTSNTMLNGSSSPSESFASTSIITGMFSRVSIESSWATGGSFTGFTVIVTDASVLLFVPLFAT